MTISVYSKSVQWNKTDIPKMVKTRIEQECRYCDTKIPKGSYVINWGYGRYYKLCLSCFQDKMLPNMKSDFNKYIKLWETINTTIKQDKNILINNTLRNL